MFVSHQEDMDICLMPQHRRICGSLLRYYLVYYEVRSCFRCLWMVWIILSPSIMPCMFLLGQDKGRVLQGWGFGSASVVRQGSARVCDYLPSYIPVIVQALVLYLYSTSEYISSIRRESFPARGSGCQSGLSSITVVPSYISHAARSIRSHTPHWVFHNPSVVQSLLALACIHQNSCAQFCHGYYIAFDYHDRSRSLNHF